MAVIKQKEQRVVMLIDAQNLYHSAKNLYGAKVNFGAVLKEAVADRHLVRAIAYVITTETEEERSFFEALNSLGIETKTKDLQIFFGGAKKADWDVGLAVDAIRLAPKADSIVIASGDGDFVPLVEYLKFMGTQVEVITFGRSASSRLREATDDFIDMCDDPRKYLLGMRGGNAGGGNPRERGVRHPRKQPSNNNRPKRETPPAKE
ncbi:MAG: NYN domain-containing protein [Patescibacteria group bacterium]